MQAAQVPWAWCWWSSCSPVKVSKMRLGEAAVADVRLGVGERGHRAR
jgi:hypothetical protein